VPAAPLSEVGYVRSQASFWVPDEEPTQELRWPDSIAVYDAMATQDAQVGSVLRAVTLPVRRTPWRIDPAGARDEVTELVAEDFGLPILGSTDTLKRRRTKDRFSWAEHLDQSLDMLVYGHQFFAQWYRPVTLDPGGFHLRKLLPLPPKTIEKIDVADDGGLVSVTQYSSKTGQRNEPIPVDRLVAYVSSKKSGNWLGRSVLRNCYGNWLLKTRVLRVGAQTIERNGMGVPLYVGAEEEEDLTDGFAMAKAWRSGQNAGTAIPHGADLRLVGVSGTLPDALPFIEYQDSQIARAVLAHFLNLGQQSGTGSYALGVTFSDFFTLSLQTLAQQIADITTQHVIEDLIDVNWGPEEPAPRLVFQEIGSRRDASAEAIRVLVESGVIRTDRDLEEFVRDVFGLPAKGRLTPPGAEPVVPAPGSPAQPSNLAPQFQAPGG
jgi:hypothetical protein